MGFAIVPKGDSRGLALHQWFPFWNGRHCRRPVLPNIFSQTRPPDTSRWDLYSVFRKRKTMFGDLFCEHDFRPTLLSAASSSLLSTFSSRYFFGVLCCDCGAICISSSLFIWFFFFLDFQKERRSFCNILECFPSLFVRRKQVKPIYITFSKAHRWAIRFYYIYIVLR